MLNKKLLKKEITLLHYLILSTSKLLIGIGVGIAIASYYFFFQPYWYVLIIIGALMLFFMLYFLMKAEVNEEIKLEKKLRK